MSTNIIIPTFSWMRPIDLPSILAIETASYPPDEAWSATDFRQALNGTVQWTGIVARRSTNILGYAVYEVTPRGLPRRRLTVHRLAVHSEHRGRGIGQAIIDELAGKARYHKVDQIKIHVHEFNTSGCRFLTACGFAFGRVEVNYYEDRDAYIYRLDVGRDIGSEKWCSGIGTRRGK